MTGTRMAVGLLGCLLAGGGFSSSQQATSNLAFDEAAMAAYQRLREQATFRGYIFRDLKNHPVFSKMDFKIPDPESNAYLKPTGVDLLSIHVDELPPGMFNAKHRGPVGGVIYVLSGRGYTLLEPVGEEEIRLDWKEGDLVSIPANAWHQDFNLDDTRPVRLLGIGLGGLISRLGIPRLPDPENERYSREFEEALEEKMGTR